MIRNYMISSIRTKWIFAGLLLCALWAGAARGDEETVTLNFVNADIDSVIKAVGMITGRNFVVDPRVKGTVNIVSAKPVARDMTYPILLSALRLQGFAAIEADGITKIVPEPDAKQNFSPIAGKTLTIGGDRIVTQVYPLQHESATQLVPILRPLISPNNNIAAYANTNTLVITDYADNVKRINKIIESIDQPNYGDITVVKLHHVSALDLSQTLTRLLSDSASGAPAGGQGGAESGQRFTVVPDVRSNSLLLRSDNPARIERARRLAEQLDVSGGESGNIHVVYLRNAEAVKLADTLRAIVSGEGRSAAATASTPLSPSTPPISGASSASVTSGAGAMMQSAPAAAATPAASGSSTGSMIQADPQTNSLIINAPDNVYNSLRAVIDKLDARRAQIFIEALIAEVSTDKEAQLGIQWQSPIGGSSSKSVVVGGTNFSTGGNNIVTLSAGSTLPATGFNLGVLEKFSVGGHDYTALSVLAQALQTVSDVNILSTPNLITLDNEEAKIVIGQNVPFITGSYAQSSATTAGATVNPFQTIDRKDVGLTLKVKPQVAEGGTVKLQIYQEASSIADTSNPAGVITNMRSIESTVLVDDGQIIVLGGLIQNDVENETDKVPGLGDVPVVGNLFKYETRKHVKTNLMVFLQPKVLRTASDADGLTGERYDFIRNEQMTSGRPADLLLHSDPAVVMPPLKSAPQAETKKAEPSTEPKASAEPPAP